MILMAPKGIKYWQEKNGELIVSDNAPEWAKKEFEKFQKQMAEAEKPDKNGNVYDL